MAGDIGLLGAVVAGAVLRFWGLGGQSLWYDEWLTTEATSGGLGDLLRHVANREGIPPPYFLLMWGWVRLFGDGEVALRSVSALAGVAAIPMAYAVVRELGMDRWAARVAALLIAVNPMLVWYSQEARPYSLLALLGAASLLAFARLWRRGRRVDWVVWAVACAGTVAVHYFAAFVVLAQALVLLVALPRLPRLSGTGAVPSERQAPTPAGLGPTARETTASGHPASVRPWRRVGLALVPSAVVLLVLAPVAVRQHSHEANRLWISDFPLSHRLADAGQSALVGPSPPSGRLWIVAALATAMAAGLLVVGADQRRRSVGVLTGAIGGLGVVLALMATAVGVDVMLGRYLIASLVPLAIAVTAGLGMWGSGVAAGTARSIGAASGGDSSTTRPLGPSGGLLGAAGETTVTETGGTPLGPVAGYAPAGPGMGGRFTAVGTRDSSIAPGASDGPTGPGIGSRRGVAFVAGMVGIGVLYVVSLVAVVAVARDPELQRTEWRQVADVVVAGGTGETGNATAAGEGSRVLVVNLHGTMAQPLLHYLDGARRLEGEATVRAEAVDVLVANGTDRPCNLLVGRGCGLIFLGAPPPEPLADRLDLVERVELDQVTVDRYRADAPVTVSRDELVSPADRPSALVLVVP